MIKTESLSKVYDGVKAVDSVSLSVGSGEVFGFLGPNGAGKTTMIGMMVGLIEPSGGKCWIDDIDVTRNPIEAKRITGYLPDGVGFYANLNARQNLKYFSRFYKINETAADTRINELLRRVGLKGVEKPVGSYSRGMKQRLGLAQALLNDPKYVFLDEPTNGLDPQGVIEFRQIIKELGAEGRTVFFSSHILNEVQQVCNTIGIISKGKIVAQGTPDEVRKRMRTDEHVTIKIGVIGEMPKLNDPRIISAEYRNDGAVLIASADIRDDLSEEMFRHGVRIRELHLEEETLEELFLNTIYKGETI